MAEERLVRFVEEALRQGVERPRVEEALGGAGWRPEEIRDALGAFADAGLPLPVPRPRPYVSAKEAFLYLVLFTALYFSAFHLGALLFELIESAFPDQTMGWSRRGSADSLRWAIAWLVVACPVFFALSWALERGVRRDPTRRSSRVRKWLTYLTLYIAAAAILGDLATLVYKLLGGELTTRFVLKVAVVAAIAGGAFSYYLGDLRAEEREAGGAVAPRRKGLWALSACLAVGAAILAALLEIGSPAERRLRTLDQQRVNAVRQLSRLAEEAWRRDGALPRDLSALAAQPWAAEIERDPESGLPYTYEPGEGRKFRLCADFARPSPEPEPAVEPDFWRHPAGRHCYEIEISEKAAP